MTVYDVTEFKGIAYYEEKTREHKKHQLDLYLPKEHKNYPVVMLIHGGFWMFGDNRAFGLYASIGRFLASHGVGVVMPNYRLSPSAKHPDHVKDVAKAFAWMKANIAGYGGKIDHMFAMGHSAGAHLVSLLATDEQYLRAEQCSIKDIRGVISTCGVYNIPDGELSVVFGGNKPDSFHIDNIAPLRGGSGLGLRKLAVGPGVPLNINLYGPVFGNEPKTRLKASPLTHVRAGLPPFLIMSAENDLPTLRPMAEEFHAALVDRLNESTLLTIPNRNHTSILFRAVDIDDPVANAILKFIHAHCDHKSCALPIV